jgi:hypothetical protein
VSAITDADPDFRDRTNVSDDFDRLIRNVYKVLLSRVRAAPASNLPTRNARCLPDGRAGMQQ